MARQAVKSDTPSIAPTIQPLRAANRCPPTTARERAASDCGRVASNTEVLAKVMAVEGAPESRVNRAAAPTNRAAAKARRTGVFHFNGAPIDLIPFKDSRHQPEGHLEFCWRAATDSDDHYVFAVAL